MPKEERYALIKDIIKLRRATEFIHLFKFIPKTWVAHDLKTNSNRMTRLIEHPEQFSYQEIIKLSKLFGVKKSDILRLIDRQLRLV